MTKKSLLLTLLLPVMCCIVLFGCGGGGSGGDSDKVPASGSSGQTSGASGDPSGNASGQGASAAESTDTRPLRDNTPNVLVPSADGLERYGSDIVTIDASHTDQGYVMVKYSGDNHKVKLQITTPSADKYTYLLSDSGDYEVFPLNGGSGTYSLSVYENVTGDKYLTAFTQTIDTSISDEFLPYLYPNQYVWFTKDNQAVALAQDLAEGAHTDLEVVENVYHYVVENITYDQEKAKNVVYGYLPVIDETLESGTGICFDYAALMSAMLRTQNIPTRLDVGYAGEAYHAWISTYVDDIGWIDNIIQFDGQSWELMDPTFASSSDNDTLADFIGDGSSYTLKYSY